MPGLYVQYGCGFSAPPGWRSFDASPTLRLERLPGVGRLVQKNARRFPDGVEPGDVVRGLPIAPGSCRGVYASHVIEHLALEDARTALRNTLSMLEPGGIFRVVVPDLRCLAQRYLESRDPEAAHRFVEATGLGLTERRRDAVGLATGLLGNSRHQWMWDHASLSHELAGVGFVRIRACDAGDCEDPRFAEVEQPDRFVEAVAIECRKGG